MCVVKCVEVKETHRCYRQDIADTLVSFCNSRSDKLFKQFMVLWMCSVTFEVSVYVCNCAYSYCVQKRGYQQLFVGNNAVYFSGNLLTCLRCGGIFNGDTRAVKCQCAHTPHQCSPLMSQFEYMPRISDWQISGEWWGSGVVICLDRHCHSLSLALVKSKLVLPFWYRVVPEKGPLNGCVYIRQTDGHQVIALWLPLDAVSVIGWGKYAEEITSTDYFTILLLLQHPFNGLFSRTTGVSRYRYQKGKTSLDLNGARDGGVWGWQWHQLDHVETICISLQTGNHASTSSVIFYRLDALPDAQPTVSRHWLFYYSAAYSFWIKLPSVLWHCWLGDRKGIRPVKSQVVECWHGYLSGARCRLAYGPEDATATHCLLLQKNPDWFYLGSPG